jgi:hypothetical protein
MKKTRGRPKTVNYTQRTIIQIDDNTRTQIQELIKGKMSIAEFFRRTAEYALQHPDIIS